MEIFVRIYLRNPVLGILIAEFQFYDNEGNAMKVLGFIYTTDNNILTFNMTTFIRYDSFNATAEPRDCVDNLGLIYRINSSLDTSFESNYAIVWLQTCLAYNSLPEVII